MYEFQKQVQREDFLALKDKFSRFRQVWFALHVLNLSFKESQLDLEVETLEEFNSEQVKSHEKYREQYKL